MLVFDLIGCKIDEMMMKADKPFEKKRDMEFNSSLHGYWSKLEGGKHVSYSGEPYAPPEIIEKDKKMSLADSMRTKILLRAYDGYYATCHVFAYYSGKEYSFGESWDKQQRICANMICTSVLKLPPIYKGNDVKDIIMDLSEYSIDGPTYRPIVLKSTIEEAAKRFPLNIDFTFQKKEESNKEAGKGDIIIVESESDHNSDDTIDLTFEEVDTESTNNNSEKKPEDKQPDAKPENDDHDSPKDQEKKPENAIFNYDNMRFIVNEDGTTNSVNNKAPANQEKKFKDLFGKYLEGVDYQVNKFPSGALECVIRKDNTFVSHVIDPGLSVGDGYYVIAMINTGNPAQPFDTIPVHYSEEEILRKVFSTTDRKYVLTPDEYQKVLTHLFKNQRIYNVIDMSALGGSIGENTKIGRIKKRPEDFRKLGQKLTFIINCIDNTPMLGRMRFSKFTSIDSFELRSDDKGGNIRSPFPPATLETKSGVVVQVEGDDVNIFFNGNSQKYHIDNYGIL